MLAYWAHEYTEVISSNPVMINTEPAERIKKTAYAVLDYNLTKYDLQLRGWAKEDPIVAKEVNRVFNLRFEFLKKAFSELGFKGEDLEMRTRLFICYHSWEQITFWHDSKRKLRKMIDSRIRLLTQK
jgi:hypothetical protein